MVKQQLPTGKVAKAKKLSSEESEGSSEEVKKGKSDKKVVEKVKACKPTAKVLDSDSDVPKKKLPSTKAGKKVTVPSSSESEEPKSSKKVKKPTKAKDDSDSDKKKKTSKKSKVDSSDSDKKKKSKKSKGKALSSSEEESAKGKKKDQKKKKQDSSSEDLKKTNKGKKVLSSVEVKKPVGKGKKVESDSESESSSVKKPKSKVPEAVKKVEPVKKQEPAKKVEPVKKVLAKDSDSESESSVKPAKKLAKDPDSESESEEKPKTKGKVLVTKKMDIDSESESESKESDEDVKKKGKNIEKTLPIKKKPAEVAAEPIVAMKKVSETDVAINLRETELFIGGLAYEATEDDIFAEFSKFGDIDTITLPMNNGTPRGIAFVNFKTPQQAAAALVLNDTEFMNRRIRVNFSSQKPDRKPFAARAGGFSSGPSSGSATVFVGNLPYDANEDSIRDFFAMCGEIKQVRIAKTPEGEVKGFGHVEFIENNAASEAVKLAGSSMGGRALRIDFAAEKAPGGRSFPPRDAPARSNAPSQSFAGKKVKL
ncbi:hypothetical protein SteCoe_36255 [Stentor coeruleus]|uniref:RRM domain-containing protein n=1 Tax=Stentor coeruleus TaxID=5963 RepID=A0A1R2AQG7_9CILI|nr:hypothetical protein SteCoe_36255 [Stentor coeruleus]